MTPNELLAKGYVQALDGSWSKPARRRVGSVGCAQREPEPVPALDRSPKTRKPSPSRVGIVIEIVSFRKRLLDSDNNQAGANKNLRDAIAKSLGVDDGDPNVKWEYSQVLTRGATGTLVKITV